MNKYSKGIHEISTDSVHHYSLVIRDKSEIYKIDVGGALDGWNTAEYIPTYGGCYYMRSKFEPNEFLTIENIGTTDIINPRIIINGRRNYYTVNDILSGIITSSMTDEEKAEAIYVFMSDYETHGHNNNLRPGPPYPEINAPPSASAFRERADPVKALNSYFAGGCSLISANFVILCRAAGLPSRAVWMCPPENPRFTLMYGETYAAYDGHCVAEVWYDNLWHLFDPDQRTFYRGSDNHNIVSYHELHLNPDLVSRTISNGFVSNLTDTHSTSYEKYFPSKEMPVEQWTSKMDMTLRPGEKFIWRWDNISKFRLGNTHRPGRGNPPNLANGKMIYNPRLILCQRNNDIKGYYLEVVGENEKEARLQPTIQSSIAEGIINMKMPYPLVGASVSADIFKSTDLDSVRIFYSILNQKWEEIPLKLLQGEQKLSCSLDSIMALKMKPAVYSLSVKFELVAEKELNNVWIRNICIETDVQMNRNALPSLAIGRNLVHFNSESEGEARILHAWKESEITHPPLAPQQPVYPADKKRIKLEDLKAIKWTGSVDPDSNDIAAYHIQVSYREDMLIPVSTNFDRLIQQSEPVWTIPDGWLLREQTYYWRVRAKDQWGAWSPWSKVWQFKVE